LCASHHRNNVHLVNRPIITVYDQEPVILVKCSVITGPVFKFHDCPGHIECSDRLSAIIEQLPVDMPVINPVAATEEDLLRVHLHGYLAWLRHQCTRRSRVYEMTSIEGSVGEHVTARTCVSGFIDADTYLTPDSYEVATYAAGSAIVATERALDGESCFALVRPPGHHAASGWGMGFCIVNNAAVAAAKALSAVDRVAIIDWDLHHGNGTQEIFYRSNRVLYCSVHAEGFFPHTGTALETGTGAGAGYTVNAPLLPGSSVGDYVHVFSDLILPVLERERPDLIIVSAGQDALFDDPIGGMSLHAGDYGTLTGLLLDASGFAPAFILEGGYGPSHSTAINAILGAVAGQRGTGPVPEPSDATRARVRMFRKLHRLSS